jgi:hypothetical protein
MPLIPHRFLFRFAHPCRYRKDMPLRGDRLLDLDDSHALDNHASLDEKKNFATVRLAWNEMGLGVQLDVRGKENAPQADVSRPRGSDGITLWLDTRDSRASHRASRYCHQFHFLPVGGGAEREEPIAVASRINRALEDAPLADSRGIAVKRTSHRSGYVLEGFLPALVLNGFDPDQHRRLGFFYSVKDEELGEQLSSITAEFPFWEDPSLWNALELVK